MSDVFTPAQRSAVMRAVRSRDTGPELKVRRTAHALGFRFRLYRPDLPGCPDLVFPARRLVLFVHGCFWHGHDCPRGRRVPASNTTYWQEKVKRNVARDLRARSELDALGWRSEIIWECMTKDADGLRAQLLDRLNRSTFPDRQLDPADAPAHTNG